MTTQPAALPPRWFIRTMWVGHRALFRLTGGRAVLVLPARGRRFGRLRLTTTGRRTGEPRVAILGYIEDGGNLVTLAMNGWGDPEPAWWLNLQSAAEAQVELVGERRRVVARNAVGEERERLWAEVQNYPGWGEDLERFAVHRSSTAVVVFEASGQND